MKLLILLFSSYITLWRYFQCSLHLPQSSNVLLSFAYDIQTCIFTISVKLWYEPWTYLPLRTLENFTQNKIYQFSKFYNVLYNMCLKFYFSTIVFLCNCYFCINTVQQFQNLQDSPLPVICTRSDQRYNQNLNYLHEYWRHFVIKIGTSIRLAKPLLLSIVLVICKFVTPCRAVPLNMYYFCSFYCLTH